MSFGSGCDSVMMLHKGQKLVVFVHEIVIRLLMLWSFDGNFSEEINKTREIFADFFEIGVCSVISCPVVILVPVGHEIVLSNR